MENKKNTPWSLTPDEWTKTEVSKLEGSYKGEKITIEWNPHISTKVIEIITTSDGLVLQVFEEGEECTLSVFPESQSSISIM